MRLVFLNEAFWPAIGGIEVLSRKALVALQSRGYETTVITSFAGDDLPERDEVDGIQVYRLPFRRALGGRDLEAIVRCRNELSRLKGHLRPDVIQLNFSGPSGYFLLAAESAVDPPFVMAVRHSLDGDISGETIVGRLLRSADWVTGNSVATLEGARRVAPDIESRSSVILNAMEAPPVGPRPLSFDPPELLCLGRIVYEKGFHVAVEAFQRIHRRFPRARLTIAGDGPERGALHEQVSRLGLERAVRFTGWIRPERVPAVIGEASIVLVPSREESFGLVALEAGLMGRPVVASRVGGLPEVVSHLETGLTVPADDADAMAEAAIRLLDDPQLAGRLGGAARIRGLNTFAFERYVDQYDALYRRLADRQRAQRKAG